MAALQHGVATVGPRGPLTDAMLAKEEGQAFLLADVDASEQFQAHVLRLAEDAVLREQIGQTGMLLYGREFTWASIWQKLNTLLANCEDKRQA